MVVDFLVLYQTLFEMFTQLFLNSEAKWR